MILEIRDLSHLDFDELLLMACELEPPEQAAPYVPIQAHEALALNPDQYTIRTLHQGPVEIYGEKKAVESIRNCSDSNT